MPVFDKSLGLRIYSGLVNNNEIPCEILKNFNTKHIQRFLKLENNSYDLTIDTIKNCYSVRHALNYLLKNLALNFDRKIADFVKTKGKYGPPDDPEARVHKLFGSDFKLVYINPNVYQDFGNSNDPSYYQLFLSLLRSVNLLLVDINQYNLDQLKISCENLDNCLFSKESSEYIADILNNYKRNGAVDLSENYVFSCDKVEGVYLLDPSKLISISSTKSDIGFSFSPCGFLIPYHFGIKSYLCEYNVINCTVPLSGASSGSLAICSSSVLNGFVNSMNIIEVTSKRLRSEDKSNKNVKNNNEENAVYNENQFKNLDDALKITLEDILIEGSSEFINNRIGKLTVAYSVIKHVKFNTRLSSKFTNVKDLVDCLRASSFIPIVSSKDTLVYKGETCYDGQLSLGRTVGCPETDSKRTIRINPYEFTSRSISKQMLTNEFITPHLAPNDQFLVYYVRLKSLIYQLNLRKISLDSFNMTDQYPKELVHSINLYNKLSSTNYLSKNNFKESQDYTKLLALWNNQSILDLFVLVVNSESNMDVDKFNAKKYELNSEMDIMNRLGSSKFFKKPIQTTPITLITYLYMQLSKYYSSSQVQIPTSIDLHMLYTPKDNSFNFNDLSNDPTINPNKEKVDNLKELVNLIMPPFILIYNYCYCNEFVHLNIPKKKLFTVSLFSDENYYLRYFYDLGRTDAFRWMIQEYIKFENYLYLRILQLSNVTGVISTGVPSTDTVVSEDTRDTISGMGDYDEEPLFEKQKKLINEYLVMVNKNLLNEQLKSNSVNFRLFKKLNNTIRNVIMSNCVDKHFSHIFTHSHFWNYNKHYKF